MSAIQKRLKFVCKLLFVTFALCLAQTTFGSKSVDETFDVLRTRTGTYTNVTVTSRAANYIMIVHASGMNSIKVQDLTLDAQRRLGYAPPAPAAETNDIATVQAKPLIGGEQKVSEQPAVNPLPPLAGTATLAIGAAVLLLGHLFFSYCCYLICFKTKTRGGLLVWLPGFQVIPLLRAADMSGWLFLVWPIAFFAWAFKIVKACDKPTFLAVFLILPVTSFFAFIYLAFSKNAPPAVPQQKYKVAPIQTQPPPLPPAQTRAQSA